MYLHDFPSLMAEQTAVLEEDFTEDDVREATASMAAGKSIWSRQPPTRSL